MTIEHQAAVIAACNVILNRRDAVRRYQDAASGRYEVTLGSARFRTYMQRHFSQLADNLSQRVIGCLADRLQVTAVDPYTPNDALKAAIESALHQHRFDSFSKRIHSAALRDGASYVLVTQTAGGDKRLHLQTADVFEVARDPEFLEEIVAGVKLWETKGGTRLTVYYADRLERFIRPNATMFSYLNGFELNGFEPYAVDGDAVQFHSLGRVPVFAYINQPNERLQGVSELASVYPIQIALNSALVNLLAASESWALPTRYIAGMLTEYDDNGDVIKPSAEAGATWVFGDSEIKIGQLPGADLRMNIEMLNDLRAEIARVSGIPQHTLLLTTAYPSGESLRVAESALIGKLRDRQITYGNSHEDLINLLVGTEEPLNCRWRECEIQSSMDVWNSAVLQRSTGVSLRQILLERGYTAPEAEEIIAAREDEDRARSELTASLFNGGGSAPGATPQDPLLHDHA